MAWRDSKGSRRRLLLFLSAMVVGVAALVAILSFGHSLERSIDEDAGSLLGADLRISSSRAFSPALESMIDSLGGVQARRVSFVASAQFSAQQPVQTVRIRAMDAGFPLYGRIIASPPEAEEKMRAGQGVLVAQSGISVARVQPGDSVTIKGRRFEVAGILIGARVENAVEMLYQPPVYMALADLDTLDGRVGTYEVFLRFDREVDTAALQSAIEEAHDVGVRTLADVKEDWDFLLEGLEAFLGLIGFFALILGGLGVGSVLQVYLKERKDTVAVLRCVGASSGRATRIYLAQSIGMGVLVGLAACAVGTLGQVIMPLGINDLLPVDMHYRVAPEGLFAGFGLGVGATVVFSLVPLSGLGAIPPLAALRSAYGRQRFRKSRLAVYALVGLGIGLCAWVQVGHIGVAILYALAMGVAFGILSLTAWAFIRMLRAVAPRIRTYTWRQGLANMHRPNNQTLLMVVALGLGTVMIMTVVLVEGAIVEKFANLNFEAEEIPDAVLFLVDAEKPEDITSMIAAHDIRILQTDILMPVSVDSIYGRSRMSDEDSTGSDRIGFDWVGGATFADHRTDSVLVEEGTLVREWQDSTQVAPVAIHAYAAREALQVAVGDTLLLRVLDRQVLTRVGSIYAGPVLGRGMATMILPQGILESLPHTRVLSLKAADPQSLAVFHGAFMDQFPDYPIINVPLVLRVVQEVFRRLNYMHRFMSLFSVITGILVLAGAVMVSRRARIEQAVLLKTLGASKRQVLSIMCVEFLFLGLLATGTGLGLAMVAAWILTGFQLEIAFIVPKVPIVLAATALVGITLGVGLLNSRGIYARPPLEVLRTEV